MMNGLISVIIVNYKAADLLQDCIRSISEQNSDLEVIVVDNNSGDYDRDIIESLRRVFNFLKVIFNKTNAGFSKANNQAFAMARGEYILFLNPDTFLFPACLEPLASLLKTSDRVGGIIPKLWMDKEKTFLMPPSDLPSLEEKFLSRLSMSDKLFFTVYQRRWLRKALTFWNSETPLEVEAISGAFFMTTREVLDAVGTFDERFPLYFEDSDLCMRVQKAGLKFYYYPKAEAVHYYNQSAKSSPEALQKFIISEGLYMEKHYKDSLARAAALFDETCQAVALPTYKAWSFSKPIKPEARSYLLFSPIETMIPCVAHKMTGELFCFNKSFVEKLAKGIYYALLITPHGIIYEKFALEKQ